MLTSNSAHKSQSSSVLLIIIVGSVIGITVSLLHTRLDWMYLLPLLLLVGIILVYLVRLWQVAGNWDLADMRLWFAGFFLIYGIAEPLTRANPYYLPSEEQLFQASWLFCLGGIGLLFSSMFSRNRCASEVQVHNSGFLFSLRWLAILGIGIGFAMLLINFQRVGGVFNAFSAPKSTVMDTLSEARGNLPYVPLLFSALSALLFSLLHWPKRNSRMAWLFFATATLLLLAFWGAYGQRLQFFIIALSFLGIISTKKPLHVSTKKMGLLLSVGFLLFFFLDYVRASDISKNGLSASISAARSRFTSLKAFTPSELVNPYGTLVIALDSDLDREYGATYVQAVPYVLPRALYPGQKPLLIEKAWRFTYIPQLYPVGWARYPGLGFLPVAEAFLNFGWLGPPIILFLIGLGMNYAQRLRGRALGSLLYAVWLPTAFYANRAAFAGVFHMMFYTGMFVVVFFLAALLMSWIGKPSLESPSLLTENHC